MQPFIPLNLQTNFGNLDLTYNSLKRNTMSAMINIPNQTDDIFEYTQYLRLLYTKFMIEYLTHDFNRCVNSTTNKSGLSDLIIMNCCKNEITNSNKRECQTISTCENIASKKEEKANADVLSEGDCNKEKVKKERICIRKESLFSTTTINGNQSLLLNKRLRNREEEPKKLMQNRTKVPKKKKRKKIVNRNSKCPHKSAKHYAKNMCSTCYHSKGREKKAWNCCHINDSHYALGLCHECYQLNYASIKR